MLLQCQAVEGLRVKGPDFGIAVVNGGGQAVGVWQVDFLSHSTAYRRRRRFGLNRRPSTSSGRLYFFRRATRPRGAAACRPPPERSTIAHFQRGGSWAAAAGVAGLADIGGGVRLDGRDPCGWYPTCRIGRLIAVGRKRRLAGAMPCPRVRVNIFQRAELRHRARAVFSPARHTGELISDESPIRLLASMSCCGSTFADGGRGPMEIVSLLVQERWCCRPPTAGCRSPVASRPAPRRPCRRRPGCQNIVGLRPLTNTCTKPGRSAILSVRASAGPAHPGMPWRVALATVVGLVAERRGARESQAMATASRAARLKRYIGSRKWRCYSGGRGESGQ